MFQYEQWIEKSSIILVADLQVPSKRRKFSLTREVMTNNLSIFKKTNVIDVERHPMVDPMKL